MGTLKPYYLCQQNGSNCAEAVERACEDRCAGLNAVFSEAVGVESRIVATGGEVAQRWDSWGCSRRFTDLIVDAFNATAEAERKALTSSVGEVMCSGASPFLNRCTARVQ